MPRQALHAKELGFIHPQSQENLFFDQEPPADFGGLLDKLRKYALTFNEKNVINDDE
jgi:23S rRNA pseudouridine1911/1915/1917 synthase